MTLFVKDNKQIYDQVSCFFVFLLSMWKHFFRNVHGMYIPCDNNSVTFKYVSDKQMGLLRLAALLQAWLNILFHNPERLEQDRNTGTWAQHMVSHSLQQVWARCGSWPSLPQVACILYIFLQEKKSSFCSRCWHNFHYLHTRYYERNLVIPVSPMFFSHCSSCHWAKQWWHKVNQPHVRSIAESSEVTLLLCPDGGGQDHGPHANSHPWDMSEHPEGKAEKAKDWLGER